MRQAVEQIDDLLSGSGNRGPRFWDNDETVFQARMSSWTVVSPGVDPLRFAMISRDRRGYGTLPRTPNVSGQKIPVAAL